MFDAKLVKDQCVEWIRNFFEENGPTCNAVVGISGGKDSTVVAGLCTEALGKDRVVGVLMPNGEQADIDCAIQLVEHLKIKHYVVNIRDAVQGLIASLPADMEITDQTSLFMLLLPLGMPILLCLDAHFPCYGQNVCVPPKIIR